MPDNHQPRTARLSTSTKWMIFFTIACIIAALCLPAIPQPLDYHAFADHRESYGIPYFLDVISNVGFLLVGLMGLAIVISGRAYFEYQDERWPYILFFVGVLLTAIGSSYYHLAPNNEGLFWDRLPMTIAFMALVSSQIVERIDRRAGLFLLVPMLLLGASSVIYWRATERMGVGNVVPYGMLQAYAVVILLLLTIFSPSRYTRSNDFYWVFAWYIASKVLEKFDAPIWSIGHLVSGHTLKHLAAAMAGVVVCNMLVHRTRRV